MSLAKHLKSWLVWVLVTTALLQVFWFLRVGSMAWLTPSSTAVQRTEWLRIWRSSSNAQPNWSHTVLARGLLPDPLRRAVIASEDSRFLEHSGMDWQALRRAVEVNFSGQRSGVLGGSTITQQLAKNMFLSGERQLLRKAQEMVIAVGLEFWLSKAQILDIYLNHVEWGEGVFGAEAAAQRYFGQSAWTLNAQQSARLAVMLPSPKRFESEVGSRYLRERSSVIRRRMRLVDVPAKVDP